eukprot:8136129-Pyramimonas_sp.AAC.1
MELRGELFVMDADIGGTRDAAAEDTDNLSLLSDDDLFEFFAKYDKTLGEDEVENGEDPLPVIPEGGEEVPQGVPQGLAK